MKKIIAILSLTVYLAATCGIVVNSHYCMKRLVSVHLFEARAKVCGKCGMNMHKGNDCCRNEISVVKLVQDQVKIPVSFYQLKPLEALAAEPSGFLLASLYNVDNRRYFENHSPPLLSGQDIYLQLGVFRI